MYIVLFALEYCVSSFSSFSSQLGTSTLSYKTSRMSTSNNSDQWVWESFYKMKYFKALCVMCASSVTYIDMTTIVNHFKIVHPTIERQPYNNWIYSNFKKTNNSSVKCNQCPNTCWTLLRDIETLIEHLCNVHKICISKQEYDASENFLWDYVKKIDDFRVTCMECDRQKKEAVIINLTKSDNLINHIKRYHIKTWAKIEEPNDISNI